MATWVAMAALALEDRKAPSVRLGQLEEMIRTSIVMVAMVSTERMDRMNLANTE